MVVSINKKKYCHCNSMYVRIYNLNYSAFVIWSRARCPSKKNFHPRPENSPRFYCIILIERLDLEYGLFRKSLNFIILEKEVFKTIGFRPISYLITITYLGKKSYEAFETSIYGNVCIMNSCSPWNIKLLFRETTNEVNIIKVSYKFILIW